MRNFEQYIDHHGLIVCMPSEDGGDSAGNTGRYRFLNSLKFKNDKERLAREAVKFEMELDMLEDPNKPHYYRRHPDQFQWWSRSNNFTRDQQRSLVIAMGALGRTRRLLGITAKHIFRGGFYQNNRHPDESLGWKLPDIAAPNHIGEYIRAFYMLGGVFKLVGILWPVLLFCDIFALLATGLASRDWEDPNEADDDNQILSVLQAKYSLPTPLSWLNRMLYIKRRPRAGFIDFLPTERTLPIRITPNTQDVTGPESAVAWKHHWIHQGPPFFETFHETLKLHLRN